MARSPEGSRDAGAAGSAAATRGRSSASTPGTSQPPLSMSEVGCIDVRVRLHGLGAEPDSLGHVRLGHVVAQAIAPEVRAGGVWYEG